MSRDSLANPFDAERYCLVVDAIQRANLPLHPLAVVPATKEQVLRIHSPAYVAAVEDFSTGRRVRASAADYDLLGPTVPVESNTYDLALLGCGAAIAAVDAVLSGAVTTAIVVARPGDHHASPGHGEGFCVFNHTAVAARHAQARHGVERVLILDFDVHHGQGTQACFASDPTVLTWSIHSYGSLYPRTGNAAEKGSGPGRGTTVNVPIEPRTRDRAYLSAFRASLARLRFEPQLLLVVAGVDAHEDDPVGDLKLSTEAFDAIGEIVRDFAHERCGGRWVSVAAGGYNRDTVGDLMSRYVRAMAGSR